MSKLVVLDIRSGRPGGEQLLVRPTDIERVAPNGKGSQVLVRGHWITVTENPEEVIDLVQEALS